MIINFVFVTIYSNAYHPPTFFDFSSFYCSIFQIKCSHLQIISLTYILFTYISIPSWSRFLLKIILNSKWVKQNSNRLFFLLWITLFFYFLWYLFISPFLISMHIFYYLDYFYYSTKILTSGSYFFHKLWNAFFMTYEINVNTLLVILISFSCVFLKTIDLLTCAFLLLVFRNHCTFIQLLCIRLRITN